MVMLASELELVMAADDWERQLGRSGSGVIGSITTGAVTGSAVGAGLGAIGLNPVTVAVGTFAGGVVGGIVGYDLFSGAYDEMWDIFYDETE